jgi:hypothetical protein
VWLEFSATAAPRSTVAVWFPSSIADALLPLQRFIGADRAFGVGDFTELFPHALLSLTAFGLTYLVVAVRTRPEPVDEVTAPAA